MKKSRKIIAIGIAIAVLVYTIIAVCLLLVNHEETYIVKQGKITEEEETTGYIIRNEKVIKGEDFNNGIYTVATEGQKVAVGQSVFRYYSDNEKDIEIKIKELNYKIQELLEQEKNIIPSADIKAIEKQIEENIQNINNMTNYQEITESKKNIDNLISKKITFIGNIVENEEIKNLIKERNSYEEQLKTGSEYLKAEIGGIVSYKVDGLEEKLTPNNFNEITEKYLDSLDLRTGKIISTSSECGKIIDNFKCYIAITMNSKNAMQTEVND